MNFEILLSIELTQYKIITKYEKMWYINWYIMWAWFVGWFFIRINFVWLTWLTSFHTKIDVSEKFFTKLHVRCGTSSEILVILAPTTFIRCKVRNYAASFDIGTAGKWNTKLDIWFMVKPNSNFTFSKSKAGATKTTNQRRKAQIVNFHML